MKKLTALLTALLLLLGAVPALADFTADEVYQRCVDFVEEADFSYTGNSDEHYLHIGIAMDSAFSPDGCTVWLFAYEDGVSIDVDYDDLVPEDRLNEMLTLLALLNSKSAEGHLVCTPSSLRLGATDFIYTLDRIPSTALIGTVVVNLYDKLGYYDAMIAEVAGGASAWDVYNASYGDK